MCILLLGLSLAFDIIMSRYRGVGDASKFDITSIINRILESNGRPVEFSEK